MLYVFIENPTLKSRTLQTPAPNGKEDMHRQVRALLSPPSRAALVPTSRGMTRVHLRQQTDWPHVISDDELCCKLLLPLRMFMGFLEKECDVFLQ